MDRYALIKYCVRFDSCIISLLRLIFIHELCHEINQLIGLLKRYAIVETDTASIFDTIGLVRFEFCQVC